MTFVRAESSFMQTHQSRGSARPRSMTRGCEVDETAGFGAIELTDALQQPLTAACNYIGAARILLRSESVSNEPLIEKLEMAELQILRAGDIVRQFQRNALREANTD